MLFCVISKSIKPSEHRCIHFAKQALIFFLLSCSNFVNLWEFACSCYGIQEIFPHEASRASECEPGSDGHRCSHLHVPPGCGVILEPCLVRGQCHLCLLRPHGLLLWSGQCGHPDGHGCSAFLCVPDS